MSGFYKKINEEIRAINQIISEEHLDEFNPLIYPGNVDTIEEKNRWKSVIIKTYENIEGKLKILTAKSGALVENRNKWLTIMNEVRERRENFEREIEIDSNIIDKVKEHPIYKEQKNR